MEQFDFIQFPIFVPQKGLFEPRWFSRCPNILVPRWRTCWSALPPIPRVDWWKTRSPWWNRATWHHLGLTHGGFCSQVMPIVMMAILTGHIWENMGTLNDYPVDLGSRNLETKPIWWIKEYEICFVRWRLIFQMDDGSSHPTKIPIVVGIFPLYPHKISISSYIIPK